ncbi:MAG: HD domain-containing protein [Nanoarchaeota archaeon]|nr:HD domain-containing protein [Nanoarchaeota archaeon]MBU1030027.1 HD domain-containing protein [Nanoarchaeota archaeon]MBU1849963.1 HD domain-containing protein [Nanoarchaeota archaeon]
MKEIIQQLEEEIKALFHKDSSGHDIYHLKRTLNNALTIQKKEGGDKLVIAVSAFLHDIHRIIQNETGSFCSPKNSLPKVKDILDKTTLTEDQKAKVLHCIEFHEEYDFSENGKTVNDAETLVLQDADNLDAIGAIGIGRTFSYGGSNNVTMWIPEKPFDRNTYEESEKDPSTIHHFYSKLLKLKENMNTKTAKNMARKRHKFMELFLQEFFDEWNGKK